MKVVLLWIAMFAFNMGSQFILHSGVFPVIPNSAETAFANQANTTFRANYSGNLDYTQQYSFASSVVGSIASGITFDWMFWYMPLDMQAAENIEALRGAMLIIAITINLLAGVELWLRRGDVFK